MKKALLLLLITCLISCTDKYLEESLEVAGIYEVNVVGVNGPHLITISIDHGDDLFIDAPFDGMYWYVAEAELHNEEDIVKEIKIRDQKLDNGIYIEGEGVYSDYTLQLDYTIEIDGDRYDFSMVGFKL